MRLTGTLEGDTFPLTEGWFVMRRADIHTTSFLRRGPRLLAAVSLLVLTACGSGGSSPSASPKVGSPEASPSTPGASASAAAKTYSANGVSFQYPAAWKDLTSQVSFNAQSQTSNQVWNVDLGPDPTNLVDVTAYSNTGVTPSNLVKMTPTVAAQIRGLLPGATVKGPFAVTMGGLKGLRFEASSKLRDGTPYASTFILVFDPTTEYFVNCQSTADRAAEIAVGCSQIQQTFAVS